MNSKIYILLPVYNRKDITANFIECLQCQTYDNYHLVLIDDGSTDGTAELVKSTISSLTVIQGLGKWWWAGSLQQAYNWLKIQCTNSQDVVLIINDDTTFRCDFLETAIKILQRSSNTLLLSQCYSQHTQKLLDIGVHVDWANLKFESANNPENINCLSTRGLFLYVKDFFAIGGFYPRFLPHYTSDYEFTMRAYRKGYNLTSEPLLKLWLNESTTGHHQINYNVSLYMFLKQIFSIKSSSNPLVFSIFVVAACPLRWKLLNLFRIWRSFYHQCYIFILKNFDICIDSKTKKY